MKTPFRWLKFLEIMFLIAAIALAILSLTSCSSQAVTGRNVRVVERTNGFVNVADQLIPVTTTTQTWTEESAQTKTTVAPDMEQIMPVIRPIAAAATGGTSSWIEGGLALLLTTATAYAAKKHSESTEKDRQISYHRQDASEGWQKAEEHALARTPPLQP